MEEVPAMEYDIDETGVKALENFLCKNPDLEKLEDLIEDFNIFTALSFVNEEIRHSRFLTWLMDPSESHGISEYFLKSFLEEISVKGKALGLSVPSVFEIDDWYLADVEVLREWKNIDILIKSDALKFVCAIENKVRSSEHGGQLHRYKDKVEKEYPGYKKIFVYLTIEGEEPSLPEYIPLSYNDIVILIEQLQKRKQDTIGEEIYSFINQYKEILRRHIVEDSDIQEICRRIYKKHKKALDLIYEFRPDKASEIHEIAVAVLNAEPTVIVDHSSKRYVRFIPKPLDFLPRVGTGWTSRIKRFLLFEIFIGDRKILLKLIIGPAPREYREKLYKIAQNNKEIFNKAGARGIGRNFCTIYKFKKDLLKLKESEEYEDFENDELKTKIEKNFEIFKNSDLPRITESIKNNWRT
jgi:hypothetical protein